MRKAICKKISKQIKNNPNYVRNVIEKLQEIISYIKTIEKKLGKLDADFAIKLDKTLNHTMRYIQLDIYTYILSEKITNQLVHLLRKMISFMDNFYKKALEVTSEETLPSKESNIIGFKNLLEFWILSKNRSGYNLRSHKIIQYSN